MTTNAPFRLVALGVAGIVPLAAWAICTCGYGDGRFTAVTIGVDGNMGDWAPVHADTDNNVCDGPANGLVDRDAPVQSTGRDLTHFAYTYDADNIYLFTERAGSVSNTQSFVYYADIDNNGFMETGEPVIGVTWRGNNRRINVYIYEYVAQAGSGDPMADGSGFGDGYTLPGSFANVPATGNPMRSGTWGSASGIQMEFHVSWAELGLAADTPFSFHVASSNAALGSSSFTAQIDDNLGGCGGGLGSFVQTGVIFAPDRPVTGLVGQTVTAVHTVTNEGNASDTFGFSSAVAGDFAPTISYYEDTDGSGTLSAGDTLLIDTDGDALPNTTPIAPGASVAVLIAYDIPATSAAGQTATVTSTASSDIQPLTSDAVTDTLSVLAGPSLTVTKNATTIYDPVNLDVGPKAIPGSIAEYSVTISNQGAGTVDADSLVIFDPIPVDSCLILADIGGAGSGPVSFTDGAPSSNLGYSYGGLADTTDDLAFSDDGGASWGYTPMPDASGCDAGVTHIDINPTGEFAADTGSGSPSVTFTFRVLVK